MFGDENMFQILELGTSVFELFLVHILFENWFGLREGSALKHIGLLIAYFISNCIYTLLDVEPIVRSSIAVLCIAVYVYFQYDTTKLSAAYGSITYIAIAILTEFITLQIMNLLRYDVAVLMTYGTGRAIYILFAKLVNLIGVIVAGVILGRNRGPLKFQQIAPLLLCQIISMYIVYVVYEAMKDTSTPDAGFLLVVLGLLYINAVVIIYIQSITAHGERLRQIELAEQHYQLQQEYYQQLQKDQAETHALWHDIKKYVIAMQAAAGAGGEKVQQEFEIIQQEFNKIGSVVDVDNAELNVILNHCVQRASASGIKVHLDVSVPPVLNISAVDLSVIIGNTVDNAIEACQLLPDSSPGIHIMLRKNNDMLFYGIDNPYVPSAPKKRGTNHGYGLKNVKKCVDKYHGYFALEQSDGMYRVSIYLNI